MGNIVNNSTDSIPIGSINLQNILNEKTTSVNDCEYTTEIGNCSSECGEGTQIVHHLITKNSSNGGKACPVDYTQKCNQKCDDDNTISSRISFVNILNIPRQETTGSKLFSVNLNNVSDLTLKDGFYLSIQYHSFFPINCEFISVSLDDHIFPISSSSILEKDGFFKHNFLITSTIKLKPFSNIILNLFIWQFSLQDSSYTIQIIANSENKN